MAAAADVPEGLIDQIGNFRLVEGGHDVDRQVGRAPKRLPAVVEGDPVQ
jgi:hypothetical protein